MKFEDLDRIYISSCLFLFLHKKPRQWADFVFCDLRADKGRSQMTCSLFCRVREKLETRIHQKGKQLKVKIGDWYVIQRCHTKARPLGLCQCGSFVNKLLLTPLDQYLQPDSLQVSLLSPSQSKSPQRAGGRASKHLRTCSLQLCLCHHSGYCYLAFTTDP